MSSEPETEPVEVASLVPHARRVLEAFHPIALAEGIDVLTEFAAFLDATMTLAAGIGISEETFLAGVRQLLDRRAEAGVGLRKKGVADA